MNTSDFLIVLFLIHALVREARFSCPSHEMMLYIYLGRVPSVFNSLSPVFGRLYNPVVLVLSSKNDRLRKPSEPSSS